METNELKFLLKLLGFPSYRASLSAFSSIKGKDKILEQLGDRELVDYTREIANVKISLAGQSLLKLDHSQLPITDKELKVLEKISKAGGEIAPSKITSLKAAERNVILETLTGRGLIEVEKKKAKNKVEIWLTERGVEELRDHYDPEGGASITLDLLNNYIRFLRKTLGDKVPPPPEYIASDEEVLQIIAKLDRELGTDNYLPIFHLREKLQPPFSRDELDQVLYRLQKNDQIELRTLVHAQDYTQEQVNAGITQRSGSPLFFIKVTE